MSNQKYSVNTLEGGWGEGIVNSRNGLLAFNNRALIPVIFDLKELQKPASFLHIVYYFKL